MCEQFYGWRLQVVCTHSWPHSRFRSASCYWWWKSFRGENSWGYHQSAIATGLGCLLPFGISAGPPDFAGLSAAAAMRHEFHYIQLWHWYEQLGIVASGGVVLVV